MQHAAVRLFPPQPECTNDDAVNGSCSIHPSLLTTCLGSTNDFPIPDVSRSVDLLDSLSVLTGFKSFKPAQEEAIASVLGGQSTLVSIPTGAGKSLCYQLPAFILRCWFAQAIQVESRLRQSILIVISPTISLMYDQLRCLPSSLRGVCINSSASFVSPLLSYALSRATNRLTRRILLTDFPTIKSMCCILVQSDCYVLPFPLLHRVRICRLYV